MNVAVGSKTYFQVKKDDTTQKKTRGQAKKIKSKTIKACFAGTSENASTALIP
jgi:hypothetical protein